MHTVKDTNQKGILVTGGAGFIGSEFVRVLVSKPEIMDKPIHILDSLTYAGDLRRLESCLEAKNVYFHEGDICDSTIVSKLMEKVSDVVHFAAESHVDRSILEPNVFVRTNIIGTQTLINSALAEEVRFVLVSTDEVYGSSRTESFTEESKLNPSSPYSASKAASELLALSSHKTHGLNLSITRAANNFGKYQNKEKLIPMTIEKLKSGNKVPIYGDGTNIRNWLHINDHCDAIYKVLISGRVGEIYNIGTTESYSNIELVKMFIMNMGLDNSYIEYVPDRSAHDFRYSIDSSKIIKELGWTPKYRLSDEIANLIVAESF